MQREFQRLEWIDKSILHSLHPNANFFIHITGRRKEGDPSYYYYWGGVEAMTPESQRDSSLFGNFSWMIYFLKPVSYSCHDYY